MERAVYFREMRAILVTRCSETNIVFPPKKIWESRALLKTCLFVVVVVFFFFAEKVVWRKILTVDILMKNGWTIVNKCSLCKDNEESINHILIHCDETKVIWTFLFAVFGLK